MQKVIASIICAGSEWHLTDAEISNPEFNSEGFLTGGFLGSIKDFCNVCDADTEIVAITLR